MDNNFQVDTSKQVKKDFLKKKQKFLWVSHFCSQVLKQ